MTFEISLVLNLIQTSLCFKWYSRPKLTSPWHFSFTCYMWKMWKSDNCQFPIHLEIVRTFHWIISDWRANKDQSTFWGTEAFLKGLPLTSKAASVYFGQIIWYWIKNLSRFERNSALTTMKAPRKLAAGAGEFPPFTAGNRYLLRFMPASAGNFTCGLCK